VNKGKDSAPGIRAWLYSPGLLTSKMGIEVERDNSSDMVIFVTDMRGLS
jgi:hypothetical protein